MDRARERWKEWRRAWRTLGPVITEGMPGDMAEAMLREWPTDELAHRAALIRAGSSFKAATRFMNAFK